MSSRVRGAARLELCERAGLRPPLLFTSLLVLFPGSAALVLPTADPASRAVAGVPPQAAESLL